MNTTTEEISTELAALESQVTVLETQMRARGLDVPARPDVAAAKQADATLDDIFAAMGLMESHAAKLRTTTRLATPLKYAPKAVAPTITKVMTADQRIAALGGIKAIEANKITGQIAELEAQLPSFDQGSVTARCIAGRIQTLRAKHAELTSGK